MATLQTNENSEFNAGICANCINASGCTHKEHSSTAVLFCEEFECLDGSCRDKSNALDYSKYIVATPDTSNGLCCNCDYRADCESNRNPGTVLYCEEYA